MGTFSLGGVVTLVRTGARRVELRAAVAALGVALFVATKVAWFSGEEPVLTGDGRIWAEIGERSLWGGGFWRSTRPFVLPLINRVLGFSDERVIWFQCLLGATAWSLVALTLTRIFTTLASKSIVFIAVLALALSSTVHGWDAVIRSESVSLSFLMLTLASLLNHLLCPVTRGWRSWMWAALTAAFAVAAAFSRDTNGFILIVAGLALIPAGCWRQRDPRRLHVVVLAGALLTVAVAANANAQAGKRYRFPLMNVVFQRVLPDAQKLAYFENELGMPVSPALMTRTKKWVSSNNWFARSSPALEEFRGWLVRDGYRGYQRYLVTHPLSTLTEAYDYFPRFAAERFPRLASRPPLEWSRRVDTLLTPSAVVGHPYLWSLAALATAATTLFVARSRRVLAGWLIAVLALASWVAAYVSFHGDAMEVDRHGMLVGILFRLAVVVTAALWLDAASSRVVLRPLVPSEGRSDP